MSIATNAIAGPHLVRYGIAADQRFLLKEFLTTYDQLVINGTMVAHTPAALAKFLTRGAKGKPYFIDPQTHAFQHDLSLLGPPSAEGGIQIRKSLRRLIDSFGNPIKSCVDGERDARPVTPGDFDSTPLVRSFCERVLKFQLNALAGAAQEPDAAKYYDYLKKKGSGSTKPLVPSLLVAPYFYLSANTAERWLETNLNCATHSMKIANDLDMPLAVQIVISKDILANTTLRQKVIERYVSQRAPAAFLIWVDSFSEQQASEFELRQYVELIKALGEGGASVVSLYGGYFSVALARLKVVGLHGVTHGLEYGEDRGVVPVGGGLPVAKFYLPALHMRMPFRQAVRAVRALGGFVSREAYSDVVCNCKECQRTVTKDPWEDFAEYGSTRPVSFIRRNLPIVMEYPLPETKVRCVRHYMWKKYDEYHDPISMDGVKTQLDQASKALEKTLGPDATAHCCTWGRVLSGL